MRMTLITLRGGTVWDEALPPDIEAVVARHIPVGEPLASYAGDAASQIASLILGDLTSFPPSPKLMVLMVNLQTIERREGSRILILR